MVARPELCHLSDVVASQNSAHHSERQSPRSVAVKDDRASQEHAADGQEHRQVGASVKRARETMHIRARPAPHDERADDRGDHAAESHEKGKQQHIAKVGASRYVEAGIY